MKMGQGKRLPSRVLGPWIEPSGPDAAVVFLLGGLSKRSTG